MRVYDTFSEQVWNAKTWLDWTGRKGRVVSVVTPRFWREVMKDATPWCDAFFYANPGSKTMFADSEVIVKYVDGVAGVTLIVYQCEHCGDDCHGDLPLCSRCFHSISEYNNQNPFSHT